MRWPLTLSRGRERHEYAPLLFSIFAISVCAIVYELLVGAVSSYLLGDSVFQFSVTIGLFLTAMGLGSFLSRHLAEDLLTTFVNVELMAGLFGGFSVPLLFFVYGSSPGIYRPVMYAIIVCIGTLVGVEIPIVARLLADRFVLRTNLANVLSIDYVGGLVGSLLFPLVLLPRLGLIPTALLFGLVNTAVAGVTVVAYRQRLAERKFQIASTAAIAVLLSLAFVQSTPLWTFLQQRLYRDTVVYSAQTKYQQITLTQWHDDIRLFLDGNLQFSSLDEYRYHEALVHPAMSLASSRRQILILGGGDGLAAREVLKYPDVEVVTLVDLDPDVVELFRSNETIAQLNEGSLRNPKVRAVAEDAFKFVESDNRLYNVVIADLPDPRNEALQKLYSVEFYSLIRRRMAAGGIMATQATSPYFARQAYWSIHATVREVWSHTHPYHADVPSFGDWGFLLASNHMLSPVDTRVSVPTRYLAPDTLSSLFVFGKDVTDPGGLSTNSIVKPQLLEYYQEGWRGAAR